MSDIENIVIGAGVVGLAVANALASRGAEVMVLERNASIGDETSSRNSGVIHAGIYYEPGSLRARLCVQGKRRLYAFCANNGVNAIRCGKLLVACNDTETGKLEALAANARNNGVDDLVMLTAGEVAQLEPDIRCVSACLSPSTGVVDAAAFIRSIDGHLQANGGQVVTNTEVRSLAQGTRGVEVRFVSSGEASKIRCRQLVIAAGHGAGALANTLFMQSRYRPPKTYPARGHYYRLQGTHRFQRLVYPLPDGAWLGTHLTLDTAGGVRFGPDNEWVEDVDYAFDDSPSRRERFTAEISRYWPTLDPDLLQPDFVGVRPKIYRRGEAVRDFAIHGAATHGIEGLVALFGIESPGLTASLAIGEYVADMLETTPGAST